MEIEQQIRARLEQTDREIRQARWIVFIGLAVSWGLAAWFVFG